MSKSRRLNKEILAKSIDAVLEMDDSDLINNVVDILVSPTEDHKYEEIRPRFKRRRGIAWAFLNHFAGANELARKVTDWLFPVPKTPPSFYADIW